MSHRGRILSLSSYLAVPIYIPPEQIEVGRTLFHHFVHDEFEHQGLSDESILENASDDIVEDHIAMAQGLEHDISSSLVLPNGYKNPVLSVVGSNIRNIATEFAESRQRKIIKEHADEVDLGILTFDGFWGLLEEVFRHGINVYNIVALFYFCSDVLVRSVKENMIQLGKNLFKWALQYIAEQVCKWVTENGGWEAVIKSVMKKKYFAYATVVVIGFAFGWGVYKGFS